MTCIVGVVDNGTVYLGADSAGAGGWDLIIRADKKLFINDGFAIGFISSFRMGQLLQYAMKPPQISDGDDIMRFMAVDFINSVRQTLKDGGYASRENEVEKAGCFLVGYKGRLFKIDTDYQVAESAHGFSAAGCGENAALGALHILRPKTEPNAAILAALNASELCSNGVRGPFHTVSV